MSSQDPPALPDTGPEAGRTSPLEGLLADCEWLSRLARRLVGDAARADDAVQSTLVHAWQRASTGERPVRAWLAAVLRNAVRQEGRSAARRTARERRVAVSEAAPSPSDVHERLSSQRWIVDAVLGLEEPYRTVIVMRYYDDLPPRTIAKRLGMPVASVTTRLERATKMLRARLDRDFDGERSAWLRALLPLARSVPPSVFPPLAGPLVLAGKLGLGVVAAGLLAVAARSLGPDEARSVESAVPDAAAPLESGPASEQQAPAPEPSAPERSSVPGSERGPELEARLAPEPVEGTARVELEVVLAGTSTSVAGARIEWQSVEAGYAERSGSQVDGRLRTDAFGRGSWNVPANRELTVRVVPPDEAGVLAGVIGGIETSRIRIAALAPGEREIVTLALRHGEGARFHGRVVDKDGAPLAAARVRPLWAGAGTSVHAAGADGSFELDYPDWRLAQAEITAPGFGSALLGLTGVLQGPGEPFVVVLASEAVLTVHLDGAELHPCDAREVRVWTNSSRIVQPAGADIFDEDPVWSGKLGEPFTGLPGDVPLRVDVWCGEELVWRHDGELTMAAGETRELNGALHGAHGVFGRVATATGEPVANRELWLVPYGVRAHPDGLTPDPDPAAEDPGRLFDIDMRNDVTLVTRTDEDGRYALEGLLPGRYWLGPAAQGDDVAPFAKALRFEGPAGAHEVDLVVTVGLAIEGRVRSRFDVDLSRTMVYALRLDESGRVRARTEADGAFRLGPLVEGRYRIFATSPGALDRGFGSLAEAGDTEVLVALESGPAIHGTVFDGETGRATDAHVGLTLPNRTGSLGIGLSGGAGRFRFSGLDPGRYDLKASTPDGRVAFLPGVELAGEGDSSELALVLVPGARLRVRYTGGAERLRLRVGRGDSILSDSKLYRDEENVVTVPEGDVEVELYSGDTVFVRDVVAVRRETLADRVYDLNH